MEECRSCGQTEARQTEARQTEALRRQLADAEAKAAALEAMCKEFSGWMEERRQEAGKDEGWYELALASQAKIGCLLDESKDNEAGEVKP